MRPQFDFELPHPSSLSVRIDAQHGCGFRFGLRFVRTCRKRPLDVLLHGDVERRDGRVRRSTIAQHVNDRHTREPLINVGSLESETGTGID